MVGLAMLGTKQTRPIVLTLKTPVSAQDHQKGSPTAKNVLIEYSDFQCSACGKFYPAVEQLAKEYADKIIFVYRHLPLRTIHPSAEVAARSSEAAALQGKFWEYYDLLFKNQEAWSKESDPAKTFQSYATSLKLDLTRFNSDVASDSVKDRVQADLDGSPFTSTSQYSTPTFFLNGERIELSFQYEEMKAIIDSRLK